MRDSHRTKTRFHINVTQASERHGALALVSHAKPAKTINACVLTRSRASRKPFTIQVEKKVAMHFLTCMLRASWPSVRTIRAGLC